MNTLLLIGGVLVILYLLLAFIKNYRDAKDSLDICGEVVSSDENGSLVETGYRFAEFCFIKNKYREGEYIWVFNRKYVESEIKAKNLYLKLHPFKARKLLNRNLYFDEYVCSDSFKATGLTLKKRVRKAWLALNPRGEIVFLSRVPEEAQPGDNVFGEKLLFPKQVPVSQEV